MIAWSPTLSKVNIVILSLGGGGEPLALDLMNAGERVLVLIALF